MKKILGITLLLLSAVIMSFSFSISEKPENIVSKKDEIGIKFSSLTYAEALKIAQQTGKLIFIDCYTDWCGPCKYLSKHTFKDEAVGKFFNENFINIKVEMEKDAEGPELARLFSVKSYPTLVFVDGNGDVILKNIGFVQPDVLLDMGQKANR